MKQPQRLPLTKQIYYHLMDEPRAHTLQYIGYYRFRLVTTLLYFTGMRLQEAGSISEQQFEELIQTNRTQIYMSKNKRYRFIVIPEKGKNILEQLKMEAKLVFDHSEKKSNKRIIRHTDQTQHSYNNFLTWYNQQLKHYLLRVAVRLEDELLFNNINLMSSHSFRINKVTQLLWKHTPLQEVSKMIGHQNVQTTNLYFRWDSHNPEILNKLNEIEED